MANTVSAKKAVRKIAKRTEVNKANRSRMRTYVRKAEEALAGGDKDQAAAAVKEVQPVLMKAVSKGIINKNTASRKVSRLNKRLKALSA
ncbi:MAG: 30S ribosomal protein S20 [Nitratireductor sp.]|nr:30S ribosomal protein S20 [Nitratireductor sp.]